MLTLVANCFGKIHRFCLIDTLPEMKAGSMPGNHIYLPYTGVSREHFRLQRREAGWLLLDLGSRNGTRLNGKRIEEAAIRSGDEIQVGTVKLTVEESRASNDTIFLQEMKRPGGRRDTEEITGAPGEEGFYFPHLIFPDGMIPGESQVMQELYRKLHSLAAGDLNVLFIGETGSGKEMLAHTLHLSGARASGPFVAVNCAAIPGELAESELFGIGEKVATNVNRRIGKLELAHGGTLLLDELSSFAMSLQAKILRALEEKVVYPVGENRPHPADFRVLATSNEDPHTLIETGRLREDLYHRVANVELPVPPLRERLQDLQGLLIGLIGQTVAREGKPVPGVQRAVLEKLRQYSYPGNVRELANIVRSMVALANPGEILHEALLPEKVRRSVVSELNANTLPMQDRLDEQARGMVLEALEANEGNITRAAQALGVTSRGLRKMMQRLEVARKKTQSR